MKYTVKQNQPLLEALELMAPDSSKSTLRSWLKQGRILVDGSLAKIGAFPVTQGQIVSLADKKAPKGLKILYQDRHIVVVDKPAGMLSVATHYETSHTVHAALKDIHRPGKVFPVHRLDRETSGVMVFALTNEARDSLKTLFEKHHIQREYHAIVEGCPQPKKGKWKGFLYEDKNYKVHATDNPNNAKFAITFYEALQIYKKTSHLKLTLETGRKNQIRVHCSEAGHPIMGDKKYGSNSPCKRLALHARLLGFAHPITGKAMEFISPLPKIFDR